MTSKTLPITADCWYLSGPTASGKTAVALDVAPRLGAEIISLDSMAIYRGMDIGTAKPSAAERSQVPHHLIDLVDPSEEFSLAQYVQAAEQVVADIRSRGAVPLFVGGTPLYLKALLRGIFVGPPADWELRRQLQAELESQGESHLHARLAEVDPQAARRLHPRDVRRIIRAIEVWQTTGRPISELQRQFDQARDAADCRVFVLDRPREALRARIDARVEQMFRDGLVDEVRELVGRSTALGRTASQALGYRETIEHLGGQRDLNDTIELVKLRTRQFAKRQMTWFRSLGECRWIAAPDDAQAADLAAMIAAAEVTG